MKANDPERVSKVTEVALSAATSSLQVLAPAAGIAGLLASAGLAIIPGAGSALASVAVRAYTKRLNERLDDWLGLVAFYLEMGSVEEAKRYIEDSIDEEWAHNGVVEGVRAILQDVEDVALPCLARLTALYLRNHQTIDARGKRATALLVRCDRARLDELRTLVTQVARHLPRDLDYCEARLTGETVSDCALVRYAENHGESFSTWSVSAAALSMFHLLKAHEFGSDTPAGGAGEASGPRIVLLYRADVEYLARVIL